MTGTDYYTLKEAGDKLGIHWRSVRNYIRAGKIQAIKVGMRGDWRIHKDELAAYIERSKV